MLQGGREDAVSTSIWAAALLAVTYRYLSLLMATLAVLPSDKHQAATMVPWCHPRNIASVGWALGWQPLRRGGTHAGEQN